jgi:hypothetical protein
MPKNLTAIANAIDYKNGPSAMIFNGARAGFTSHFLNSGETATFENLAQLALKRRPLSINPSANDNDGTDHRHKQNSEQDGIFNEGRALFVVDQLLQDLQTLTHDSLLLK